MSIRAVESALAVDGLTPAQKLTLVVLAERDGPGGCWPGIESVAARVGVSPRHAQRTIGELAERGLVTIEVNGGGNDATRRDRRPNRYHLHLDGVTPMSPRDYAQRGDTHVTPCPNGVTPTSERGDMGARHGVTPMSPEPSMNRERTPDPLGGQLTREQLAESAGDHYARSEQDRGAPVRSLSGLARSKSRELLDHHSERLDRLIERDALRRGRGLDPVPFSVLCAAALGDGRSLAHYPFPDEEFASV